MNPFICTAHKCGKLLIHDFDNLLSREKAVDYVGSDSTVRDLFYEISNYFKVDIRLEQSELYFPHSCFNVVFSKLSLIFELFKGGIDFIGKILEHRLSFPFCK